ESFIAGSASIYRHDGSAWQELANCVVNTTNRTVTCQTSGFSVFGLFGELSPNTPEPTPPVDNGTTDPEPDPPAFVDKSGSKTTDNQTDQQGQTEAVSDRRDLASAFTEKVKNVIKRPAAWASLLVVAVTVIVLILIR